MRDGTLGGRPPPEEEREPGRRLDDDDNAEPRRSGAMTTTQRDDDDVDMEAVARAGLAEEMDLWIAVAQDEAEKGSADG